MKKKKSEKKEEKSHTDNQRDIYCNVSEQKNVKCVIGIIEKCYNE